MKRCIKCGKEFPATDEFFQTREKGILRNQCRECAHQHRIKYYREHHEKALANTRQWCINNPEKVTENRKRWEEINRVSENERKKKWRMDNPEKYTEICHLSYLKYRSERLEYNRLWQQTHRDERRASCKKWYASHKEHRAKYSAKYRHEHSEHRSEIYKLWAKANPEKVNENLWKRRARKMNAEGSHTSEDIRRQYQNQGGLCWWCGKDVGDTYHADHVVPLSRGGSDNASNIVISCPSCNQSKHSKLPNEWRGKVV
jgi:hypothetical protein